MEKFKLFFLFVGLLLLGLFSQPVNAQISEGGLPPSFSLREVTLKSSSIRSAYTAPINFKVHELIEEDFQNESMGVPLRAGVIIPANLSMENSGEWIALDQGVRVWQLEISAPDAIALMLYYEDFYIPEGGKLFIYNEQRNHLIGAYTSRTNVSGGKFATELVAGDKIILEYVAPTSSSLSLIDFEKGELDTQQIDNKARIHISGIGYGYNYLDVYYRKLSDDMQLKMGESQWCMINVNCEEGANWKVQKNGVAKTLTPIGNGMYFCSGTILNNTNEDLSPYFLTASHCFYNDSKDVQCENFSQVIYYFNYESFGCEDEFPTQTKTMVGAELLVELPTVGGLAGVGGSDGALLRLIDQIPADYNVYYNGWDHRDIAPTSGVGIHHPAGDIKKISTYQTTAGEITWTNGAENAWWNVQWAATTNGKGLTEGGSSGSPLFNQEGKVVGALTGAPVQPGLPSCSQPIQYQRSYYGKLSYHWDNLNKIDPNTTMKTYLDPKETGQAALGGTYSGGENKSHAMFTYNKAEIIVFSSVSYSDASAGATTWNWEFEGGAPASFEGKTPPAIVYNAPSDASGFTTKLTINKGTETEHSKEVTIHVKELGDNPVSPKSIFSLNTHYELKEGFDGNDVTTPPEGWRIKKNNDSQSQWVFTNLNLEPLIFASIDPESVRSALVQYDDNNVVDTWLISPEFAIKEDTWLEFYALFSPAHTDANRFLSVSFSKDNATTWEEIWSNADLGGEGEIEWNKYKVMLDQYVGENVVLGLRYYGKGGFFAGFDGLKVATPTAADEKVVIGFGDYISPVDLSTGPPILYEWTFEGGTPATSTLQEPGLIRYMQEGTFDVTLKVKNYRGEHTYTFSDAVTVKHTTPTVDFSVGGYTRTDFTRALPGNTPVAFKDLSGNYPTAWEWTFEGGTPATSTEQNPTVSYTTDGLFNVSLTAKNKAGENTEEKEKYVYAGSMSHDIWNMYEGEQTDQTLRTAPNNYLTGSNAGALMMGFYPVSFNEFAERFDAPLAQAVLRKVAIYFKIGDAPNRDDLTLNIYKEGANGRPLATPYYTQSIPVSSLNNSEYTIIEFDEEVLVGGAFYVSVGGFKQTSEQMILIGSSGMRDVKDNTAYFYSYVHNIEGRPWLSISEHYGVGISMNIVPELTYIYDEGLEAEKKVFRKNIDDTVEHVEVKSNLNWQVSSDPWIIIDKTSGSGKGSFTYTVSENEEAATRTGAITIKNTLSENYILVVQAGSNPKELTATVIDEDEGNVKLDWQAPGSRKPYVVGDNIVEDVESHTDYLINSAGYYGWTYIDADDGNPVEFSGFNAPNTDKKSAFMVLNAYRSGSPIKAHSGDKMFASVFTDKEIKDDWMISPELNFDGEDFTFSFWATRTPGSYLVEHIRVLYSTGGNSMEDFAGNVVSDGEFEPVAETWTKHEYTIPGNAKYVAINCLSPFRGAVSYIDDLFIGRADGSETKAVLNEDSISKQQTTLLDRKTLYEKEHGLEKLSSDEIEAMKASAKVLSDNTVINITNETSGETIKVDRPSDLSVNTRSAVEESLSSIILLESTDANKVKLQTETEGLKSAENETILRWGSGISAGNAIGVETYAEMEVGIRFSPKDLREFNGSIISAVEVYLFKLPENGLTLNVRQGDELVLSEEVTDVVVGEYMRIPLSKPITVDLLETLTITYKYVQAPSVTVAAIDAGPAVKGKGDLIYNEQLGFVSLSEMAGHSFNWLMALVIEDRETGFEYNVYRNDEKIGTVSTNSYSDLEVEASDLAYTVTALYPGALESTPSNVATVNLKQQLIVTAQDMTRVLGMSNPQFILTYEGFADQETEKDLDVQPTATTTATVESPVGKYPITASGGSDTKYRFKYVDGTLTVREPYLLTITADDVEKYVGEVNPEVVGGYTAKGFVDNDNLSYLSTQPHAFIDPLFKQHIGVGTYNDAVIVEGAEDGTGKYDFKYVFGSLIVKDHPTSVEDVDASAVKVYPTLTTGILHVGVSESGLDAEIYDFLGRIVTKESLTVGDNTLNISKLEKGVYFVKVGAVVTKVIKQ